MNKSLGQKKIIPDKMQDLQRWNLSRKNFIRTAVAGGIFTSLPIFKISAGVATGKEKVLNKHDRYIIRSVQKILFPDDGNGPGANDIHALEYLEWVLSDAEKDPDEIKYIINGIGWINELANEVFGKGYHELTLSEQEKLVAKTSKERWGENWLSVILTFIFEALLCDPKYPGNPESIGWEWLTHNPGLPRPTSELIYPEILTTIREKTD